MTWTLIYGPPHLEGHGQRATPVISGISRSARPYRHARFGHASVWCITTLPHFVCKLAPRSACRCLRLCMHV